MTTKPRQISQLSALRKARRWSKAGLAWHFHLLSPRCLFNSTNSNVLIIESSAGTFYTSTHHKLFSVGAHLLKLFLENNRFTFAPGHGQGKVRKIVSRIKQLKKKKVTWHHHLLLPHCKFNHYGSKWVVIFEDPLENKETEIAYPHYPDKDVREIERLFYSQHK